MTGTYRLARITGEAKTAASPRRRRTTCGFATAVLAGLMLSGAVLVTVPGPAAAQTTSAATTDQGIGNVIAEAILARLGTVSDPAIGAYYAARGGQPLWVLSEGAEAGLSENGHLAIAAFAAANDHALNPDNYAPIDLARRADAAATAEDYATLDIDLTRNYVRYGTHLASGRVQPNVVSKALNIFPEIPDPADLLNAVSQSPDFGAYLEGLAPQSPSYARLKQRLADYRDKAARGGFTHVPAGETLKPGMTDPRLDALRKRMAEEDYLTAAAHTGDVYDGALVEAVKQFQEYHGLTVDGVIGPGTLAEINASITQRLIQMELNMERRRWMPDDLGSTYIFVNLADQVLKVVKNDKTIHTARVVVGKPYHATPVFSRNMTYVEVNPFWSVPQSIAVNEYLPKLIKNPSALSGQNIRVFKGDTEVNPASVAWASFKGTGLPYQLRQDPGDKNALGRIKFMFPNAFNIYIHDTPSKALFDRSERYFSHGCIRVSDPFALGEVLLAAQGFDRAKLEKIRDSGDRQVITLKEPVPVHLTYLTAWMNKDGSTHFRPDIYERDEALLKALARAMRENL